MGTAQRLRGGSINSCSRARLERNPDPLALGDSEHVVTAGEDGGQAQLGGDQKEL